MSAPSLSRTMFPNWVDCPIHSADGSQDRIGLLDGRVYKRNLKSIGNLNHIPVYMIDAT